MNILFLFLSVKTVLRFEAVDRAKNPSLPPRNVEKSDEIFAEISDLSEFFADFCSKKGFGAKKKFDIIDYWLLII
ncbi:MAG: hypothetical protein LBD59_07895 [Prevotellaceae bacterium]|nr:hypothetical protein [Prevotellaceae bacterium]